MKRADGSSNLSGRAGSGCNRVLSNPRYNLVKCTVGVLQRSVEFATEHDTDHPALAAALMHAVGLMQIGSA
jgi:hypothetical protein